MERRKKMDKDQIMLNGLISKGAMVKELNLTDDELAKINKFTLSPLTADDVYVFKVAICDNDIDRHFERFADKAIDEMAELFIGKPLIKDHERKADHQVGRIYDTEVITSDSLKTSDGEPLIQLVAHCYVLNNDSNDKLVSEIKGGIKKEVSVGLRVNKAVCNICGTDNTKNYCDHWWGRDYEGKTCVFTLDDPVDAFEVSFVAVPAQAKAGTFKAHGIDTKDIANKPDYDSKNEDTLAQEIALQFKALDAFIYIQNEKNKEV